ncbi:GNAT family N-acetyltransferase [Zhihengliuella sp.]|uniref:GNAT family N-acetyltransferase n=1 Tax=Zhihengliuella sp. TaxID=1954483 RepID=UPI00281123C3|nr:GNAT family N-acetyltransferase [Zhihengliuella sp.]
MIYAFIVRPVESPDGDVYRDIVSPYGYGGAYVRGTLSELQKVEFWSRFERWLSNTGIVSQFVRLDVDLERLLPHPGEVRTSAFNIVRTLDIAPDELWTDFEKKVRKNYKKAERSGVNVIEDPRGRHLADFLRIYEGTMDRRNAGEQYYFDETFFKSLISNLPENVVFFHAVLGGAIVSTELVLTSSDRLFSFLGGTDSAAFDYRPNDALKVGIMRWGIENGFRSFVLGGGARPGDGIERYKRSFAPSGAVPFWTGRITHNKEAYAELVAQRMNDFVAANVEWKESTYYPAYRTPLPERPAEDNNKDIE